MPKTNPSRPCDRRAQGGLCGGLARVVTVLAVAFGALLGTAPLRPAAAAATDWARTDQAALRLVTANDATGDSRTITVGLQFRLQPGWKTYWRSPGDAGFPMAVDWTGSENLDRAQIEWPAAERFTVLGLTTIGYADEVVFPVQLTLRQPGQPLNLRARVNYLACAEVCVPNSATLVLDLPQGPANVSGEAPLIARYVERLPASFAAAHLSIERASVAPGAKGPVLELALRGSRPFAHPDVFVEGKGIVVADAPAVRLEDGGRLAVLRSPLAVDKQTAQSLAGQALTLTVVDQGISAETQQVVSLSAGAQDGGLGLLAVLATALLGGLILNLMPCVLPVLSVKLLSVVGHGGQSARNVRLSFLASASGILVSFLALAALAIGLKQAGVSVAQGMQFQQPLFLVAMMAVLVAFAVNLAGRFEIALPGRLHNALAGVGHHGTLGGAFLGGALATLLATPCSAPYVGTAVGFALSRGPFEIGLVFAMLGVGLALPYLAVAAVPRLATRLPRPGRWMIVLRRILGVALLATAAWLGVVLWAIVGTPGTAIAVVLLVGLALALWFVRRLGPLAGAVAVVLALAAIVVPSLVMRPPVADETAAASLWRPFDQKAIATEVANKKVVFVDVTADWCLTCQVNKKLVIDDPVVAARLMHGVVAMRADWTQPSDAIAAYLQSFGRYGIPFNVVYGPAAPQGVVLPELLSTDAVVKALDEAAGDKAASR